MWLSACLDPCHSDSSLLLCVSTVLHIILRNLRVCVTFFLYPMICVSNIVRPPLGVKTVLGNLHSVV